MWRDELPLIREILIPIALSIKNIIEKKCRAWVLYKLIIMAANNTITVNYI